MRRRQTVLLLQRRFRQIIARRRNRE